MKITPMHRYEILSVWEIGHRWHDLDPDASDPQNPQAKAKEAMRELLRALNVYIHAYDAHREFVPMEYLWFGFPKTSFAKALEKRLRQRIYDKDFLDAVFIRQDELADWCRGEGIDPPAFWFPEIARTKEAKQEAKPEIEIRELSPPKEPAKPKVGIKEKARKAALQKHAPYRKIKEELFRFWDAGHYRSQAEAVRRFIKLRGVENLKPMSPSNAERTLKEALSGYLKSKRQR